MSTILYLSHFVVPLKSDLDIQQTHFTSCICSLPILSTKQFRIQRPFKVELSLSFCSMNWSLASQFVGQKLMLSSSFRCDQIYKCQRYDFGPTQLGYISHTYMFNKPTSEFKNLNNCLNTNIYSYLETSGAQSYFNHRFEKNNQMQPRDCQGRPFLKMLWF